MSELIARLRLLGAEGALRLPLPAGGRTAERHLALLKVARADLSLARLLEAHTDAIAILAEQGRAPRMDGIYGVWASDGPQSRLTAEKTASGWSVSGLKQYCSGAGIIDAALVTVHSADGLLLFEMPLDVRGVAVLQSQWATPAFSDTATGPVSFEGVSVPSSCVIGAPGWYLDRPGFWHGAIGPAACWAGGASSLIDAAIASNRNDPHSLAQIGALTALGWGFEAILTKAGDEIDTCATDCGQARRRALMVRHLIERWCTEVLDRFGQATGPQLLAHDPFIVRQHAALAVYMRQCHGARDLQALACVNQQKNRV